MSWEIWTDDKTSRLCARFRDQLSSADGETSAREYLGSLGDRSWHVVFDVSQMSGYDSAARTAWRQVLWPRRQQLLSMTLIGGSGLVRMGGQMLGFALGVPVRSLASWDELSDLAEVDVASQA